MALIYILIIFFTTLIIYQLFLATFGLDNLIEGLENEGEYKDYNKDDPNNALILSQQNAGNIDVLKGRIDKFDGVKDMIDGMKQNIDSMQTQIDGLVEQQVQFSQDMVGTEPPEITGTEEMDAEDEEDV